jgi:uncharacterized membrane protein YhaH (DUF805 family)
MGFFEAISVCFSKYFDFSGRAARSEFWYFRLFIVIYSTTLNIAVKLFADAAPNQNFAWFILALSAAVIIPDLSVQVRRLHDRDLSGFWLLPIYVLIPGAFFSVFYLNDQVNEQVTSAQQDGIVMLGIVWVIWLLGILIIDMLPGTSGANKYGMDPLAKSKREEGEVVDQKPVDFGKIIAPTEPTMSAAAPASNATLPLNGAVADMPKGPPAILKPTSVTQEGKDIILKYNDRASAVYKKLEGYPSSLRDQLMDQLVSDPSQDPELVFRGVVLAYLGRSDLEWTDEIFEALNDVRLVGPKVCDEFVKVFPILSRTMLPSEIAEKVVKLSRGEVRRTYLFPGKEKSQHRVHAYSDGTFSIDGRAAVFQTVEWVYEALETPVADRVPLYFLDYEVPK